MTVNAVTLLYTDKTRQAGVCCCVYSEKPSCWFCSAGPGGSGLSVRLRWRSGSVLTRQAGMTETACEGDEGRWGGTTTTTNISSSAFCSVRSSSTLSPGPDWNWRSSQTDQTLFYRTSIPSARFLQDFSSRISNVTTELREDINAFFVGTVDTGFIPSILKVSPALTSSPDIKELTRVLSTSMKSMVWSTELVL